MPMTVREYRRGWRQSTKWHLKRFEWTKEETIHILKCLWWTFRPKRFIPNYKSRT
jgi:hypothetical protein